MLAPRQYRDQRGQVFSYQARPPPQRGRSCYHQSARPRFPPAPGPGPRALCRVRPCGACRSPPWR